jgi:hypothetical protein
MKTTMIAICLITSFMTTASYADKTLSLAKVKGEVQATDWKHRTLDVRVPDGQILKLQVAHDAPIADKDQNDRAIGLEEVRKGDSVSVIYDTKSNTVAALSRTAHMDLQ